MTEPRSYASLSSGLLARKGTAKPAMRPQGFSSLEDLGWNDMGHGAAETSRAAPAPEHVPSSIAALTPAPKAMRSVPDCEAGYDEADEAEAFEAGEPQPIDEVADFAPVPAIEDEPVDSEAAEAEATEIVEPFGVEFEPQAEFEAADDPESEPETFDEPFANAIEAVGTPPVVSQQRAILERFDAAPEVEAVPSPVRAPHTARAEIVPLPKRPFVVGGRKAAFTLRLDGDRHLRLRLACAVTGHSAQQIVAHALDEALAGIPEIEALAAQVPAKNSRAGAAKRN
jgi:hypothetical protein